MRWLRRLRPAAAERARPQAEPMEPRLLFSADLTGGLLLGADVGAGAAAEHRTLTESGEYASLAAESAAATPESSAATVAAYAQLPLAFEQNQGQADVGIDFLAQGSGYGIALANGNAVLNFNTDLGQHTVGLELVGARPSEGAGEGQLQGYSNYLVGNEAAKWFTGIANHAAVLYQDVYDGIDLRYYGNQQQLEYDFIVGAGADPGAIALRFSGVESVSIAANGDLLLRVQGTDNEVRFKAPVSYQSGADGLEAVASSYVVRADGSIGFALGSYDRSRELVIDPVLDYATYLGASGAEQALGVAVDSAGNVYVTGRTTSSGSPFGSTEGPVGGSGDIFVAKLSADLSTLYWATRIGGGNDEQGNAIAVDASGNHVAVTGWTKSSNFYTQNPADPTLGDLLPLGRPDAVVIKLAAASGTVEFSTYYGGDDADSGNAVAFDGAGNVYVAGEASPSGLLSGLLSPLLGGSTNAFVNKYLPSGAAAYQQMLGGSVDDIATGLAVGSGGDVYVVGTTRSGAWALGNQDSVTMNGAQSTLAGSTDGFLVRLDASGNNALYATYIGGPGADTASAVAIDGTGKAYVVGSTRWNGSAGFATAGAFMTSGLGSNHDTGFLRIYDTADNGASSLLYSTYIGGSGVDRPTGVAVAGSRVIVVGEAGSSTDFKVTADAWQATNPANALFLLAFNPLGGGTTDLLYGTFYGANATGGGVAVTGNHAVLVGSTPSTGYGTAGTFQPGKSGGTDALIASFALPNTAPVLIGIVQPAALDEDSSVSFRVSELLAGKVIDLDAGALQGVAITGVDTSHGTWEYTTDGVGWSAITGLSASSALLLAADAQTQIRFTPAANFSGTVSAGLTVRAWDRTSGSAGLRADTTSNGGTTAFSGATRTVDLTVTAVNDAPEAADVSAGGAEDAASIAVNLTGTDVEDGTAVTFTLQGLPTDGTLYTDAGLTAAAVTGSAYASGVLHFVPSANFNGTVSFTYTVTDSGGRSDSTPATATINVAAINDAPAAADVTINGAEDDASISVTLVGVDVEDAASVTLTLQGLPADGTLYTDAALTSLAVTGVAYASGSFYFAPAANFNGSTSFTYTVTDTTGLTDVTPATATINVAAVNDEPVAVDVTANGTEDAVIGVTLSGSDVEDGASVTFTLQGLPVQGTLYTDAALNTTAVAGTAYASSNFYFVPTANFNGSTNFTYTVTDTAGLSDATPATATITVAAVNDAPAAADVSASGMEDAPSIVITLAGSDVEDGASVTFSLQGLPSNGILYTDAALTTLAVTGTAYTSGSYYFAPASDFNGSTSFAYSVTDTAGLSDATPATAILDIAAVNDAPTTSDVSLSAIDEDSSHTLTAAELLANAGDVDGDSLSVANLSASSGTLVDLGGGTWSFTPDLNDDTAVNFTYDISDGTATIAGLASLDLTPVNDPPATTDVDLGAISEDGSRTITEADLLASATDIDGGAFSVSNLSASSGTLVDLGGGTWSFTPDLNDDTAVSFTYDISDGFATIVGTANLDLTPVNDAPSTSDVALGAIAEEGSRIITESELLANAGDIDGGAPSVGNLSAGSGTLVDLGGGAWTFTPDANDDTAVSFTYDISDGVATIAGSASLDLAPVNDAPSTAAVSLVAIAEDTARTITQAQLLANAADVDGDALVATNLVASSGTLVDLGGGTWTFTPDANDDTAVSFTYDISDGVATIAGTASLDLTPVNDPTTTSDVALGAITEDGTRTITAGELLANAVDIDGDALSVSNLVASSGTLADLGGGTWTFTPEANDDTAVGFTYDISDGVATIAGAADLDLTPVNDSPSTSDVALGAIAEDGARTITQAELLANAADVDSGALSASNLTASSGTLVDLGGGIWSFTPDANDDTAVRFSYDISDGVATTKGSASLDLTPVNDAPTTTGIALGAVAEDTTRTITQAQLLATAADIDGDALAVTNLVASSGTLVDLGGGTWRFTPDANDNTAVSFTYTVSDGVATVAASASLDLTPVNDAPAANDDVRSTVEDTAITFTAASLLGNDNDVEGDALTIAQVASGPGGSAVLHADGSVTFTPDADFNGAASFDYTVRDGSATSAPATVTVNVAAVNDAPRANDDLLAGNENAGRTFAASELLANDVDAEGGPLTIVSVSSGPGGTAVLNGDGTVGFMPAPDFRGVASFTYTVSDGSLRSGVATAGVVITPVVDAPGASTPPSGPTTPPAPGPVEKPGHPAPAAAPAAVPAAAPAAASPGRIGEVGAELLAAPQPGGADGGFAGGFQADAVRIGGVPEIEHLRALPGVVFDRTALQLIAAQAPGDLLLSGFGVQGQSEGARMEDLQRSLRSTAFTSELDRLREFVREDLDLDRSVTISVASVSLGLSLIYVLWLIRGGILVGSYLSALPAWRILDPLPVLSRVDEEPDEEEDEPLQDGDNKARNTLRGFG